MILVSGRPCPDSGRFRLSFRPPWTVRDARTPRNLRHMRRRRVAAWARCAVISAQFSHACGTFHVHTPVLFAPAIPQNIKRGRYITHTRRQDVNHDAPAMHLPPMN